MIAIEALKTIVLSMIGRGRREDATGVKGEGCGVTLEELDRESVRSEGISLARISACTGRLS